MLAPASGAKGCKTTPRRRARQGGGSFSTYLNLSASLAMLDTHGALRARLFFG
jgi:hypothetical protein